MNLSAHITLILTCVKMGFKRSLTSKAFVAGTLITYTTLMILFSGVIKMIPPSVLAPYGLNHVQMIWYMGGGELMTFLGIGWAFKELQSDYQAGIVQSSLIRPSSYLLMRGSLWYGECMVRALIMLPYYLILIPLLSDGTHLPLRSVLSFMAALPISMLISTCSACVIGSLCLWIMQGEPAYWIWEKLTFLLGAMLWPLSLYPMFLQHAVWFTPFPAIVSAGAGAVLHTDMMRVLLVFAHQLIWAGIFLFGLRIFDRKVLRRIQSVGG